MAETRANRRRYTRVKIAIPVRVAGHTRDGRAWEEIASTEDASLRGLSFRVTTRVEQGELLHLTLPMPRQLRLYDDSESTYSIYGVVRSVLALSGGQSARVRFLGKRPPRGHVTNPGARYAMQDDPVPEPNEPRDRRRAPRYDVFMNLHLGRLAANGGQSERTVTENMSANGARVPTTLLLSPGETVTVSELDGDFRTEAVARGVYVGHDRVPRVNLSFSTPAPRRLVLTSGA